jgi:DNA-directed RNA polymerase subunit RPC12/RpoP
MKITGFKCANVAGEPLRCDAFGNNAAISCPNCGHPILFVELPNQKGSSSSHPTVCVECNKSFYMELFEKTEIIIVHEQQVNKPDLK